jgi:hypothetical protein
MCRLVCAFLLLLSAALLTTLEPRTAFANTCGDACAKKYHDCYVAANSSSGREACREAFKDCVRTCPMGEGSNEGK